jgi:hypothetical protein
MFCKIIIICSLIFSVGRFTVAGHALSAAGSYEALAHIWVGFLLAFFLQECVWFTKWIKNDISNPLPASKGFAGPAILVMTLIETYMFIYQGWFTITMGK